MLCDLPLAYLLAVREADVTDTVRERDLSKSEGQTTETATTRRQNSRTVNFSPSGWSLTVKATESGPWPGHRIVLKSGASLQIQETWNLARHLVQ